MILVALLAITPLIVDQVRSVNADRAGHLAAASRQAIGLARHAANEEADLFEKAEAFLQAVGYSYTTFALTNSECNHYLTELRGRVDWAQTISMVGPDGRIVCSSNPDSIGLDLSDRAHFREAVETGRFAVSGFLEGRRYKGSTVFANFPLRKPDGTLVAVASSSLNLDWITRLTRSLAEESGAVVQMIDGKGTVIARAPDDEGFVGRRFENLPLIHEMLTHSEGNITAADVDGVRRVLSYVQLPGTNARIAVGFDEREVLRGVDRQMWLSYAKTSILSVILFAGIWFGGERLLIRPIRSLERIAARLGSGQLDARASEHRWTAEFSPLASALDDMADKLAARDRELRVANERLAEQAEGDPLTGIANRRTFNTRLNAEWRIAIRSRNPVALMMIDFDYFKEFNDCYGHVDGDSCLKTLAQLLAGSVREPSDLAARFGGDEFVLILPGASLAEATTTAERLRANVFAQRIPHRGSPIGLVTVTIGVASLVPQSMSADGNDVSALIEAADAMLYAAKKRGRNSVMSQSPLNLVKAS